MPKRQSWESIGAKNIAGYTIVLDIDGTLLPDNEPLPSLNIVEHVRRLAQRNTIYLLTNSFRSGRARNIAEHIGLPLVDTRMRKPDPRILSQIPTTHGEILVIGDKISTDMFFAMSTGTKFLLMERLYGTNDRFAVRITYLLDDILGWFASLFSVLKKMEP
jgi:predicted HAD superfamily phosphohydrolase YqeG